MKVLVVDDIRTNRILALRILERFGHKVKAVESGIAAIDRIRDEDFDIVLMDIQMPDMSGIEAARIIRKNSSPVRNSEMAILAFSAGTDLTANDYRNAGINGCIAKPINPYQLLEMIGQYERSLSKQKCP